VTAVAAGTGWTSTPWGEGDIEVALGLDFQHLEIDSFDSMAYGDSVDGETGEDRTLSFRLLGDHTLGAGTLRGALTIAETWHEEILATGPSAEYRQRLWSVGVETEQPVGTASAGGILASPSVTVGFSLDGSSTPETGESTPQPAIRGWGGRLAGQVGIGEAVAVHGGVSRKVRFPALRELYSGALGRFAPNPGLDPLTLWVAEAAGTARPTEGLEVQATVFEQRLVGAIVRAVLPDGRFQRQNRGETRATGVEVLATGRLGGFGVRADLTLQDVRLLDDEDGSGERPEYQPEVVAGLDVEAPRFLGVRAFAELEHLGTQFGANPETGAFERIEPTTYLEAGATRRFADPPGGLPPLSLSITVENLGDALILDQLGLPRPGRTFRFEAALF
jgi:iron complex outermembrane receptor protein